MRKPIPCHRWTVLLVALALLPASAFAQKSPEETLKSLKVADGLELTLWASEPGMVNPTNMDIDHRGRIWVTEAANYRSTFQKWGFLRPEGDRIVILEDTDKDGKCDSYKVFYQDKTIQAPLGISVVGDKVYLAQSPNVMVFTIDESGDKPKGPPEVILTGFGGVDHDHAVHAGVFGPDGKFYFNAGNEGMTKLVKRASGTPGEVKEGENVVDQTGSEVGRGQKKWRGRAKEKGELGYTDGMAFRMDLDGSNFESLAYNFRNNYELTVDSFGTVWQSDNDDDGNQGVRLNYVMEGGNFGFKGPKGSAWSRDAAAVPGQTKQQAHWHQLWPGVVPNMIHTGGGSPTGIAIYEGDLLGGKYRGSILHCDAGPNVVRAYMPQPTTAVPVGLMTDAKAYSEGTSPGAGYKATWVDLVKGEQDKWFRPADVCVAPDGSVFIADWYDPGVGGHNMQDKEKGQDRMSLAGLKGRIYRLAPPGHKGSVPALNLETVGGQIAALKSPNLVARQLAWTQLHEGREPAAKALKAMYDSEKNPYYKARALWLLAKGPEGNKHVMTALKDADVNIRCAAVRAARQIKMDMVEVANQVLADSSAPPQVLREVALAMNYEPAERAVPVLVNLADRFDGKDRWYLEAIGIGATGKEKELLQAWEMRQKSNNPETTAKLKWRLNMEPPLPAVSAADEGQEPATTLTVATTDPAAAPPAEQALKDKTGKPLPKIAVLAQRKGDAKAGRAIFETNKLANCTQCHKVGDAGGDVGPPLTTIGEKLSREQLFESILYPSNAILMGFEAWIVKKKDGDVVDGLLAGETDDTVTIKNTKGEYIDIPAGDVASKKQQKISIMPEGLPAGLTQQELVDLVDYLTTLKNQ
jgi:putative membrane-bound dehydrogenase-like protein